MEWYEPYIPTKSVSYKCYTTTYFSYSNDLYIWLTDYKKDNAILVKFMTLENEPTEKEMIKHIKNCIKNRRKRWKKKTKKLLSA